jgi:hypothetical protein
LDSLYKKTWKTHRDYEALGAALLEMKKTAQYVNDKAKEADKTKKLIQIESSLIGLKKLRLIGNSSKKESSITEPKKGNGRKDISFYSAIVWSGPVIIVNKREVIYLLKKLH